MYVKPIESMSSFGHKRKSVQTGDREKKIINQHDNSKFYMKKLNRIIIGRKPRENIECSTQF
jgi:hypothetical protein